MSHVISEAAELFLHPRYRLLERIGKGGMGEVFRALDRLTGRAVALKRVQLPSGSAGADSPRPAAPGSPAGQPVAAHLAAVQAGLSDQRAIPISPQSIGDPELRQTPHYVPGPSAFAATAMAAPISVPQAAPTTLVAIGSAALPSSPHTEALRLHLTQEFRTLASLRHPHIVSVLDYGFDQHRQPYFTMELLEAAVPLDAAAHGETLSGKVGLVLQILQALTYLHRRGILHREITGAIAGGVVRS